MTMTTRRITRICGVLVILASVVGALFAQEHPGPHWGYSGSIGPDHWADLDKTFNACHLGHRQSPIDIRATRQADLPPIQFAYQPTPLHIVNNGHAIQVNYAPGSFITVGDAQYQLTQLHFHHPSEERINGRGSEMVAHLVHAAPNGNIAVVAVLLDPGAANPVITSLWQHLPAREGLEQKFDDVQVDATGLLPKDHGYYTYAGSLTTPPCTEDVTWFVLKTREPISQSQANAFGKIFPHDVRPIQALNGREVLASK